MLHGLWDLSSLTRDWTQALSIESTESWPPDNQGIPFREWFWWLNEIMHICQSLAHNKFSTKSYNFNARTNICIIYIVFGDGLKYEIQDSKEQISSSSEESMTYISDKPYLPHWEINPFAMQPGAWLTALWEQLVSCSSHWLIPCSSQGDLCLEMRSFAWGIPNWVKQHKSGTS